MLEGSRRHLTEAGETYWEHFHFATTIGLLALAAGVAALLHALIPGICTTAASRTIRHLGQLIDNRSQIDAIESAAIEAKAFALLLVLGTAAVAPLWILDVPTALRVTYTLLAYALPASMLITNPDLAEQEA